MNSKEINEAIARLGASTWELEQTYIENGGEVTEDTERMEQDIAAIKELLTVGGTDDLGRWMKAKQDEIAAYKAEKQAAEMRIRSAQRSEKYIDSLIERVMQATGQDKIKGMFYSFSQYTSTKTAVNEAALDDAYLSKVMIAARTAGLPDCIDVVLKTNTTRLKDAGEEFERYLEVTSTPTVKFVKPRAAKEA